MSSLLKKWIAILAVIPGIILIYFIISYSKKPVNYLENQDGLLTLQQSKLIFKEIQQFPNHTQMALALISNDSSVFYGVIKNNNSVRQIDNKHAVFEIGSITKVFTSTLLADFVLDSILTLERDINEDLDFELNNNIRISYKELANHTSGLLRLPSNMIYSVIKSPLNPYKYYTAEKLENYLSKKMKVADNKTYEYSNLGVGILGYILCQKSKCDYETLLKEKIFSKYGLNHTTTIRKNVVGNLVTGIGPLGNRTPNWDLASLEAAGGILSNVTDLTKFVMAQFDSTNSELALTRKSTFVVNSRKDIGLGWHILKDKSDNNWYFHNGGTGGYRCALVLDTETRTGIIILTNISVGHRKSKQIDELCFELMKSINGSGKKPINVND